MKTLTARFVESAKPNPAKRLEFHDHVVRGLSLRISSKGVKTWALRYRTAAGEQRRLTLGGYPAVALDEARRKATKALGEVASDRDPAREKLAERRSARRARVEKPQTLADLWGLYARDQLRTKRPSTARYQNWLWGKEIGPRLGGIMIADLDRATVRAAIREIGERAPVQANRALALVRRLFNFALDEELIKATPISKLPRLYRETSRDRVLSDAELATLWRGLETAPHAKGVAVSPRMCAAIRLALLTGARAGDVAGLRVEELDFAARVWVIPASRFKSKRPHTVPLSDAAWDILKGVIPNAPSGFVFPHARDENAPMQRASLTNAMRAVCKHAGVHGASVHDLRRTLATYLASERIGIAPHIVGAVLGHTVSNVTAVYNRHDYDREKRLALAAWATLLNQIVTGGAGSRNVIAMASRR